MTPRRLILSVLTIIVLIRLSTALLGSFSEPQITSRLELYQTDILLHATELSADNPSGLGRPEVRRSLLGEDPFGSALEQYQKVREAAQENSQRLDAQLNELTAEAIATPESAVGSPAEVQLQAALQQQQALLDQLDLKIGILQAEKDQLPAAQQTWTDLQNRLQQQGDTESATVKTAQVLSGLWSQPAQLLPDAEAQIQQNLDGWFRFTALGQLYQLQQRTDALAQITAEEQAIAQSNLVKLAIVGSLPILACLLGALLLIFLIGQRILKGKDSLLERNGNTAWSTPWDWETVWQVLIVGFFFAGQILLPILLHDVGMSLSANGNRARAFYAMSYYLLMAGTSLLVLYFSIKSFLPLPDGWFRLKFKSAWLLWGVGGYLVALPLMILISLANQQIWQGEGGSNPLLQIVLEEADPIALSIFFFTAAVAAPIFEETLFRGFLLPSLTRYVPVWGAIGISSLVFAIAHLSLSEVIPLTLLGSVLGLVYTRSRNLLAPMLLHGLWNSATMIGLFVLGSGG